MQKNVMKALVLSVSRFDFKDKETGKSVRGAKVCYVPDKIQESDNKRGLEPCFVSSDYHIFEQFTALPGFYNLSFSLRNFRGNVSICFQNAEFLEKVEFNAGE
jgi:hypothetical protein